MKILLTTPREDQSFFELHYNVEQAKNSALGKVGGKPLNWIEHEAGDFAEIGFLQEEIDKFGEGTFTDNDVQGPCFIIQMLSIDEPYYDEIQKRMHMFLSSSMDLLLSFYDCEYFNDMIKDTYGTTKIELPTKASLIHMKKVFNTIAYNEKYKRWIGPENDKS